MIHHHDLVLADRRLKVCEITETGTISKNPAFNFGNQKTIGANKCNSETTLELFLTLFKRNPKEF